MDSVEERFLKAICVMNLDNWDYFSQNPELAPYHNNNPESILIEKQNMEQMTVGLSPSGELLFDLIKQSHKKSFRKLWPKLRDYGWTWDKIRKTQKEIRQHLRYRAQERLQT